MLLVKGKEKLFISIKICGSEIPIVKESSNAEFNTKCLNVMVTHTCKDLQIGYIGDPEG